MGEQQQRALTTTRNQGGNKRDQLKRSAAFASSTFVTMGLVDLFGHMGPTGLLIAGLASYVAWNHGPEVLENIQGQVREILPPGEQEVEDEQGQSEDDRPRGRGFWERALNVPSDEHGKSLQNTPQWDDEYVEPEEDLELFERMTFRELVQMGVIQKAIARGEMLLGFVNGEPRYGTWKDFNSCGVGGVSGSGKSTTIRFLGFQTVLLGGRFIMIDPDIQEKEESLAAQFRAFRKNHVFEPCDGNASALTKRVRWLQKEYRRREERGIKGPPIILVLDELNKLIRRLSPELRKELTDLLLDISQDGRKFGMYTLLIAQRWSEQDLGGKPWGVAIRTSLASTLTHRFTDEEQGKKLIGSKNGPRCLELENGHYLFRDTNGRLSEIVTPDTRYEDSDLVLQLLGQSGATEASSVEKAQPVEKEAATLINLSERVRRSGVVRSPFYEQTVPPSTMNGAAPSRSTTRATSNVSTDESPFEASSEVARSGYDEGDFEGAETPYTDREQQILDMFLKEKLTAFQIAKQLSGATGGTEYTKASNEVAEVFRKAMKRG